MGGDAPYRLDELGWLQFERLCTELLSLECGIAPGDWRGRADSTRLALVDRDVRVPGRQEPLPGPVLAAIVWRRAGRERHALPPAGEDGRRSLLLLTNRVEQEPEPDAVVLGPHELGAILDARPELRRRVPSVLGVRDLAPLIPSDAVAGSTFDLAAARELARAYVPTRAYARTLEVLGLHRFAVLTGPPELGKTAAARMIGLALLADGWHVHECTSPDQLWRLFDRERRQLFVADDAFGSTEYRPEAAERWALELDRVLQAMDERHLLIWTSRPAPLRAGLRRIHREHGVERFPQPAEVQISAADLDLEEKALILFRHTQASAPHGWAVELVRRHGPAIVEHPHFTPERIRRFVATRLPQLTAAHARADAMLVAEAVAAEIREPTRAMAESLRSLDPEYRALLVALLDAPPGPVPERELAAAFRRLEDAGLPRAPGELVDRLADHFLHHVPPTSVTWVHPSWRDLTIDELAADSPARRRFLERCSLDGVLLALSVGGGAAGERAYPLLREDGDWDALAERLPALLRELPAHDVVRLLGGLQAAVEEGPAGPAAAEAAALAGEALADARRLWDDARAPVPVALLEAWHGLAAALPEPPEPPAVAATWVELLPTPSLDLADSADVERLEEWLRLLELLDLRGERAPRVEALDEVVSPLLERAATVSADEPPELRLRLGRVLRRLARLAPARVGELRYAAALLTADVDVVEAVTTVVWPPPRWSDDEPDIVGRVLRDLRASA